MLDRLSDRYGWRGLWLILMGLAWLLFGIGVLLDPNPPRPYVLYEFAPIWVEASVWWITGAIAIWQGTRGPDRADWPGHVALYVMPAIRLASFALSWALFAITSGLEATGICNGAIGYAQGWYAALLWALISVMLALGASWPNPPDPIPRPPASVSQED